MTNSNRRTFIKSSVSIGALSALSYSRVLGANDQINVAVIGVRGRGRSHISGFDSIDRVNVSAMCDVDKNVLDKEAAKLGKPVKKYGDFRKLLEDKNIDVVSIASPDHWHVPLSAFSILAGKHVYVEKPLSHTLQEGRYLADLAKREMKIVQHGTQSRSLKSFQNAVEYLQSGKLGKVRMAKAINHQLREQIGREPDGPVPDGVDYNLWLGPAPKRAFSKNRFHYNWHWHWDYGSGDMGNDGIHQIDIARWGLGVGFPKAVVCSGGQLFYNDDHETPDTQTAIYEYDDTAIIYEMRLWTDYKMEGHDNGDIFYGDNGSMSVGRKGWSVTFKDGTPGPSEPRGGEQHFVNFIEAIRKNEPELLTANLEDAHISSAMCHMGNIAILTKSRLEFDSAKERFVNNPKANGMLSKEYRKGFELP
jgi:predicted dehydrogenase